MQVFFLDETQNSRHQVSLKWTSKLSPRLLSRHILPVTCILFQDIIHFLHEREQTSLEYINSLFTCSYVRIHVMYFMYVLLGISEFNG